MNAFGKIGPLSTAQAGIPLLQMEESCTESHANADEAIGELHFSERLDSGLERAPTNLKRALGRAVRRHPVQAREGSHPCARSIGGQLRNITLGPPMHVDNPHASRRELIRQYVALLREHDEMLKVISAHDAPKLNTDLNPKGAGADHLPQPGCQRKAKRSLRPSIPSRLLSKGMPGSMSRPARRASS